jgi:hypothetical protein
MSEREHYIEKAKAKLDQWNAEIDKLKAKVSRSAATAATLAFSSMMAF